MTEIDEDATLSQLALAWVNMAVVSLFIALRFYLFEFYCNYICLGQRKIEGCFLHLPRNDGQIWSNCSSSCWTSLYTDSTAEVRGG